MFEVYSRTGKLLASCPTQVEAERLLGCWCTSLCIVQVLEDGSRVIVFTRREMVDR